MFKFLMGYGSESRVLCPLKVSIECEGTERHCGTCMQKLRRLTAHVSTMKTLPDRLLWQNKRGIQERERNGL